MSKYVAKLDISFEATEEEIKERLDIETAPTEKQVNQYFDEILENYAGSNDGSELLANASYDVSKQE